VRDVSKKRLRILVIQPFSPTGGRSTLNSASQPTPDRQTYPVNHEGDLATVLLVEDTEDNRQMMRRLLEMSGFRVVEATNGKEAVDVASQVQPQIILMDLSLPIIDGLAATRQIRNRPELNTVPIVAVSAHDTADFHSEALEAGCDAYVTKPINYTELEDLVNRLIAGNQ
jgi:two-component system cell cycle response regulator DivK